ncbi:O-methyltransferase-domain-containing protein [Echria macrotheca]|uniref:O-methyltransferase-domain-containing protein n=1 Tax=Echria macrotheca TaxID=438768 RepID=A0AAJ0BFD7_9PEZI|nr:O-methyltransferase-domain-containing protein [Echria macrotheca]
MPDCKWFLITQQSCKGTSTKIGVSHPDHSAASITKTSLVSAAMDSDLENLRLKAQNLDAAGRIQFMKGLRDLQLSIETPADTLNRYSGLHLEVAGTRVGGDLGLFELLSSSAPAPLGVQELASKTGAAPLLISRIARYLASIGTIAETGPGTFTANSITKTLAEPGYKGCIRHFFDNCGPVFQALPEFLAEVKYQDVTDSAQTAFQKAFSTDLPAFMWFPTQPEQFNHFQQAMTVQGRQGTQWFTAFPFEKEASDMATRETVLVDVGGGFGHQSARLLEAFPQLAGKLVVQDLPATFAMLPPPAQGLLSKDSPIKAQPHDFFTPQPVKGARFYYLRNVLHDWPDDKCVEILRNLADAFGPQDQPSHILIDEMVLPDQGVPWQATTLDLTMMGALASRERTVGEWHDLLDRAGLKVLRIDTYALDKRDSIIQVGRK